MNYTSVQPGSTSGLTVVLHVNQDDYLYASSSSAGFRVNVKLDYYELIYRTHLVTHANWRYTVSFLFAFEVFFSVRDSGAAVHHLDTMDKFARARTDRQIDGRTDGRHTIAIPR